MVKAYCGSFLNVLAQYMKTKNHLKDNKAIF